MTDTLIEKLKALRPTSLMGKWMLDKCIKIVEPHRQSYVPAQTSEISVIEGEDANALAASLVELHKWSFIKGSSAGNINPDAMRKAIQMYMKIINTHLDAVTKPVSSEIRSIMNEAKSDIAVSGEPYQISLTRWGSSEQAMDIAENHISSEWMPPTLETIGRWKQHGAISRRDWVNVLALLEGYMKPVSGVSECCLENVDGERYCPKCRWECRINVAEQPVDVTTEDYENIHEAARHIIFKLLPTGDGCLSRREAINLGHAVAKEVSAWVVVSNNKREEINLAEVKLLATAVLRILPDTNTCTPEEVEQDRILIIRTAQKYFNMTDGIEGDKSNG